MEDHSVYRFHYNGKRVRENLGVPDTAKTGRSLVNFALPFVLQSEWGDFDYAAQFPNSPNLKHFGLGKKRDNR